MQISIIATGEYRDGNWVPTEIKAVSPESGRYTITLDTDGTFCAESDLVGDESPVFSGGLTFEQVWLGMAHAFGVIAP